MWFPSMLKRSIHGVPFLLLVIAKMFPESEKVSPFMAFMAKKGAFSGIHVKMKFLILAKRTSFQIDLAGLHLVFEVLGSDIFYCSHWAAPFLL
jgi:hypothetical protein